MRRLRGDVAGMSGLAILGIVLFLGGIVLSAIAGFPLDGFVVTLATVILLVLLGSVAIAARGLLVPAALLLALWLGIAASHFAFGGI